MRVIDIISENWANNAHLGAGSERAQDQRLLEKQPKKTKRQSKLKEGIPIPPALIAALMRKFPQLASTPGKIEAMAAEIIKKEANPQLYKKPVKTTYPPENPNPVDMSHMTASERDAALEEEGEVGYEVPDLDTSTVRSNTRPQQLVNPLYQPPTSGNVQNLTPANYDEINPFRPAITTAASSEPERLRLAALHGGSINNLGAEAEYRRGNSTFGLNVRPGFRGGQGGYDANYQYQFNPNTTAGIGMSADQGKGVTNYNANITRNKGPWQVAGNVDVDAQNPSNFKAGVNARYNF